MTQYRRDQASRSQAAHKPVAFDEHRLGTMSRRGDGCGKATRPAAANDDIGFGYNGDLS